MMPCDKIFSMAQIREADACTIREKNITSWELMETAATACVGWLEKNARGATRYAIVCGLGNNGGDGLAIARLLSHIGEIQTVDVYVLRTSPRSSADFQRNYAQLQHCSRVSIYEIVPGAAFRLVRPADVLVDAIIGSGLSATITGWLATVVETINTLRMPVVSIDIPSGLLADTPPAQAATAIKADSVLSFQFPKLTFLFPEAADFVKSFDVVPIGISEQFITANATTNYFITPDYVLSLLKKRPKFSHKGNFGHALLVAGSYGKMGAAVLSAKACLRAGAGLLTVHVPEKGAAILQTAFPETMLSIDADAEIFTSVAEQLAPYNAIGIGPGIGTDTRTQQALHQLLKQAPRPLVIDADALNILSENKNWMDSVPKESILTPHVKEFERLAGKAFATSFERLEAAKELAARYGLIIVLKGAYTAVCHPCGDVYFNSTGNPGMATAGSGDVLTGIITSLLAQGYAPLEAATAGVFLHGRAGDKAASQKGQAALLASDIVDGLSEN